MEHNNSNSDIIFYLDTQNIDNSAVPLLKNTICLLVLWSLYYMIYMFLSTSLKILVSYQILNTPCFLITKSKYSLTTSVFSQVFCNSGIKYLVSTTKKYYSYYSSEIPVRLFGKSISISVQRRSWAEASYRQDLQCTGTSLVIYGQKKNFLHVVWLRTVPPQWQKACQVTGTLQNLDAII